MTFADLSEAGDQEYFGDGVAEEILNLLAQLDDLRVTSRSSSFSLKGQNLDIPTMGRKLGVNHVLEGSIRRDGNRVRITAQLIEVETDAHLWSETFDREVMDIFAVQDEIAMAIVEALKIEFSGPTMDMVSTASSSIDAYDLYLLGRHNMARRTKADLEAARTYFERAIEADPAFAPAHAGLAQSLILLTDRHYGDLITDEISTLAIPELETALALDPDLAEVYGVYGLYYLTIVDFPKGQKALEKAIQLNPNYAEAWTWVSSIYSGTFQFEKATEALEKGYMLDPLSLLGRNNYVGFKAYTGALEEAEEISRSLIQDYPNHPFGYTSLASIYRQQGRLAEALEQDLIGLEKDPELGGNKNSIDETLADLKSIELSNLAVGFAGPLVSIAAGGGGEVLESWLAASPVDGRQTVEQIGVANLMMIFGDQAEAFRLLDAIFGSGYNAKSAILDPTMEGLGTTAYAWLLRERGDHQAFDAMVAIIRARLELFLDGGSYPDFWYGYVRLLVLEGKNDEAIEELSKLVDSGFRAWYTEIDFVTEALHDDPRFKEIIARLDAAVEIERQKAFAALGD
ncbi:MAG: hypothetical protein V3R64_08425 [Sphingomonadales bacterium]